MVRRGRMRTRRLKSRSQIFFPYKEELSVGRMEFAAAGDNDRHLTGDLMATTGGFMTRGDVGLSGTYGLLSFQDARANGSQWSRGREAHVH